MRLSVRKIARYANQGLTRSAGRVIASMIDCLVSAAATTRRDPGTLEVVARSDLVDEVPDLGALDVERARTAGSERREAGEQRKRLRSARQAPTSLRCRLSDISTPKLASSVTIAVPP